MIPAFDHLTLINNIYYISILDSAEAMSDGDRSATFGDAVECFLDDCLGGGVEC
jgi:hypothetical protein